jgi:hypothetical protein
MTDYQISPNTRKCTTTGREMRPGEVFFSVLLDESGKFVRKDYAADAWNGPPTGAFSFWRGKVPSSQAPRRPPIDDEVLFDCFVRLEGESEPSRIAFRYVLGLLLVRRKRLKMEQTRQEGGREVLILRCSRSGGRYEVANPGLGDDEMESVQEDVFQALGWE